LEEVDLLKSAALAKLKKEFPYGFSQNWAEAIRKLFSLFRLKPVELLSCPPPEGGGNLKR
jgi:hypothetical protein